MQIIFQFDGQTRRLTYDEQKGSYTDRVGLLLSEKEKSCCRLNMAEFSRLPSLQDSAIQFRPT